MTDTTVSASCVYDSRGRMLTERKAINGAGTYTTSYAYDAMDRVVTTTYPSGEVVAQTYNAAAQLAQVRSATYNLNYASGLTYNAMGQMTALPLNNNNLTTNYTYEAHVEHKCKATRAEMNLGDTQSRLRLNSHMAT